MSAEPYLSAEVERLRALVSELERRLSSATPDSPVDSSQVPVGRRTRTASSPFSTDAMLEASEELAKLGAFVWDTRTRTLSWSNGLRAMLDYSPHDEPDVQLALAAIHPDDRSRVQRLAQEALSGYEVPPTELRLEREDGTLVYLRAQARPGLDADGSLLFVRGAVMDVTERKQLESQLLQGQKLEAVGTLAGGVAHDFNNFLQIIGGHCSLLKLDRDLSERSRSSLDEIDSSLVRCRELIQRLLAFGRHHMSSPSLNEARTMLGSATRMLERLIGEDVLLQTRIGAEPCPVRIDPVEFEQMIVNLAVNARAAMPNGGTLYVDLRRVALAVDEGKKHGLEAGEYCRLMVRDTGAGIPENIIDHIFEPFFTTKPRGEGSGLGLSTVHGIVNRARGSIRVSSEAGQGSSFVVMLPISGSEPAFLAPPPTVLSMPSGSETILLVEDSDQVREVTRVQLERAGYRVLVARDGNSALEVARKHGKRIHLLLTDIMMPGMGGAELEARLKQQQPELRTVFMSGYSEQMVMRKGEMHHRPVALPKPFSMQTLRLVVREHLDRDDAK